MKRQIMKIHVGSPQLPAATPAPDGATLNVPLELCPPVQHVHRLVTWTGGIANRGVVVPVVCRVGCCGY